MLVMMLEVEVEMGHSSQILKVSSTLLKSWRFREARLILGTSTVLT